MLREPVRAQLLARPLAVWQCVICNRRNCLTVHHCHSQRDPAIWMCGHGVRINCGAGTATGLSQTTQPPSRVTTRSVHGWLRGSTVGLRRRVWSGCEVCGYVAVCRPRSNTTGICYVPPSFCATKLRAALVLCAGVHKCGVRASQSAQFRARACNARARRRGRAPSVQPHDIVTEPLRRWLAVAHTYTDSAHR